MFEKKQFDKNIKVELEEFRVPHKYIRDETVLLQYRVVAVSSGAKRVNIGYTETHVGCAFGPLVNFPEELIDSVQKQCDKLKEQKLESERKAASQTKAAATAND